MNNFFRFFIIVQICFVVGCKSITENVFSQKQASHVEIGIVGVQKASVLKNSFHSLGYINLNSPIKLEVIKSEFSNKTFKDFINAKMSQSSSLSIEYADSLKSIPQYISFRIADVLSLLNELNSTNNYDVKAYLETHEKASIVTSVSIAYSKAVTEEFFNAEAVYLVPSGITSYQFQLVQKNKEIKNISFNEGVTLDYKISETCWKKSRQNKTMLVDLIPKGGKCSFGTYKSPRYIKAEVDYFKF